MRIKIYTVFLLAIAFVCANNFTASGKKPQKTKTTVKISFAGDCTLGYDSSYGYAGSFLDEFDKQGNDYGYFFRNVAHIFENSDLAVVNLEGPLTNAEIRAVKKFVFKGPPEFTNILKEGGIGAVNIANNHTFDYLQQGYDDTLESLEKAGIESFGNSRACMIDVNGITVGLLGYNALASVQAAKDGVKKDVEEAKLNGAQLVVVSFHWGIETEHYPNGYQKDLAHYAVDCGADLVVGHHPHVMQGIELYKDAYIIYSLGNFSFGGNKNPPDKDTFIFQQEFTFMEGIYTESSIKIIPCLISSVKTRNDFKPTPALGDDYERVVKKLKEYSAPLNENDILQNSFVSAGETSLGYISRKISRKLF